MFSQPTSTAIGETNAYVKVEANRDEEGAVIIGPRNFYTTGIKTGAADDSLFSRPPYAKGDKYENPPQKMAPKERNTYLKGGHEVDFKPAKVLNT